MNSKFPVSRISADTLTLDARKKLSRDYEVVCIEIQGSGGGECGKQYNRSRILDIKFLNAPVLAAVHFWGNTKVLYLTRAGEGNSEKIYRAVIKTILQKKERQEDEKGNPLPLESEGDIPARARVIPMTDGETLPAYVLYRLLLANTKEILSLTADIYEYRGTKGNEIITYRYRIGSDMTLYLGVVTFTRLSAFKAAPKQGESKKDKEKRDAEYRRKLLFRYPAYIFCPQSNTLERCFTTVNVDPNRKTEDSEISASDIYVIKKIGDGRNDEPYFEIPSMERTDEDGNVISQWRKFEQSRAFHVIKLAAEFNRIYEKYGLRLDFTEGALLRHVKSGGDAWQANDKKITSSMSGRKINIFCEQGENPEAAEKVKEAVQALGKKDKRFSSLLAEVSVGEDPAAWNIHLIHNRDYYRGGDDPYKRKSSCITQHVTFETVKEASSLTAIARCLVWQLAVKSDNAAVTSGGRGSFSLFDCSRLGFAGASFIVCLCSEEEIRGSRVNVFRYFILEMECADSSYVIYEWDDLYPENVPDWEKYEPVINLMEKEEYQGKRRDGKADIEFAVMIGRDINIFRKTGIRTLPDPKTIVQWESSSNAGVGIKTAKDGEPVILGPKSAVSKEGPLLGCVDISMINLEDGTYYCVGAMGKNLNNSWMSRASLLYKAECVGESTMLVDKILDMMCVEFVRSGQLTTLPFPVKYIREFATAK